MTRYLGLAEYLWLAEQVTGIDTTTLIKASRVELADSALHAPAAGFGDGDQVAERRYRAREFGHRIAAVNRRRERRLEDAAGAPDLCVCGRGSRTSCREPWARGPL